MLTTFAGTGTYGFSGDGGPSMNAELAGAGGLAFDAAGNMYVADGGNSRIRKISMVPNAVADSFSVLVNKHCYGADFTITVLHYHPGWSIKTYYGDGTSDSGTVLNNLLGGYVNFTHPYNAAGTYTIKSILMNGSTRIDSVVYSYTYTFCRTIPVAFYYDNHGTCIYDSVNDPFITLPVRVEVDSNSIPVDTITATSGIYYDAQGSVGDVYSFKIISLPAGLVVTCPSSGVFYDTLTGTASDTKFIGLSCSGIPGFDLGENVNFITGRHQAIANIIIYNTMCSPENAELTMNFSNKYNFISSNPVASYAVGNKIKWNLSNVTNNPARIVTIGASFAIPAGTSWLLTGDTVNSNFTTLAPITGDLDTTNNYDFRVDTITGSYDPNEMAVNPAGYIISGTQLKYTVNFENTGNDTAFNIYVLDTLSDNVDPMSLQIVGASAFMNTYKYTAGGHTVFKFDFPGINLLDSSHHNQCDGMLMFTVNAKNGLPDGTTIFNHAGIFFDYNPVVLTGFVEDIICSACLPEKVIALQSAKVALFPNPATDRLTITADMNEYSTFAITDEIGQKMLQQPFTGNRTNVNVQPFPSGLYYITLKGESGTKVIKFVKM